MQPTYTQRCKFNAIYSARWAMKSLCVRMFDGRVMYVCVCVCVVWVQAKCMDVWVCVWRSCRVMFIDVECSSLHTNMLYGVWVNGILCCALWNVTEMWIVGRSIDIAMLLGHYFTSDGPLTIYIIISCSLLLLSSSSSSSSLLQMCILFVAVE